MWQLQVKRRVLKYERYSHQEDRLLESELLHSAFDDTSLESDDARLELFGEINLYYYCMNVKHLPSRSLRRRSSIQ